MAVNEPLRLGTRRSSLALEQARHVADALTARTGRGAELVGVTTYGDTTSAALSQIGGMGVFVSALRERVLDGDVDAAVHSLKDLPTQPAPGLRIAAVPRREDPYDALIARDGLTLAELPPGARVGTGSLRRAAQLRAHHPKLDVVSIRGNVDTRIGKVASGECDAVVLACAGLARLGRSAEVTERLDATRMVPAPGQGALAVECRDDDTALLATLAGLDDEASRAAVTAERAVLATLEAGCSAPVGAYAEIVRAAAGQQGDTLHVRAVVASVDGETTIEQSSEGPVAAAEDLGRALATEMLARGAEALMGRATA